MEASQFPVYTIGHSNHSPNKFLELLEKYGIETVADVRSVPYSRYAPHFSHDTLKDMLESVGVDYLFLGGELGGRPADRTCYGNEGRVLYDRVAETEYFNDGIRRLLWVSDESRVVIMCTEKDPLECHRTLLVARFLWESGIAVEHIRSEGGIETHESAMDRLLRLFKLPPNGDMFRSKADVVSEALMFQGQKVGYVNENRIRAPKNKEEVF